MKKLKREGEDADVNGNIYNTDRSEAEQLCQHRPAMPSVRYPEQNRVHDVITLG